MNYNYSHYHVLSGGTGRRADGAAQAGEVAAAYYKTKYRFIELSRFCAAPTSSRPMASSSSRYFQQGTRRNNGSAILLTGEGQADRAAPSKKKGGGGGFGEAPQISVGEAQRYNEINGGVGGQGGEGDIEGGMGGFGQGPRFAKMLVVVDGNAAARVPHLTIGKFCKQFQLSEKIWRLLQEEGYETAGGAVGRGRCGAEERGVQGWADCGGKEGVEGVCGQHAVSEGAGLLAAMTRGGWGVYTRIMGLGLAQSHF
ncbi:hypothetical protein B0H14DRAFT_2568746 [Mycena olivaceomarginata]|nr:hypothetical protein B0H14DRAFT_2568746 [Mycena olivaceomarginata]